MNQERLLITVFLTATVTKAEVNAVGELIAGDRFIAKPVVLTTCSPVSRNA